MQPLTKHDCVPDLLDRPFVGATEVIEQSHAHEHFLRQIKTKTKMKNKKTNKKSALLMSGRVENFGNCGFPKCWDVKIICFTDVETFLHKKRGVEVQI